MLKNKIFDKIKLITELTNNEVVFLGSICAKLNNVNYGWDIGDIDIYLKNKNDVEKLNTLGDIRYFNSEIFNSDRASLRVDGVLIDVFIGKSIGDIKITEYGGLELKHEKLADMIKHLETLIMGFSDKERKLFLPKYQHKLNECMLTYNSINNIN